MFLHASRTARSLPSDTFDASVRGEPRRALAASFFADGACCLKVPVEIDGDPRPTHARLSPRASATHRARGAPVSASRRRGRERPHLCHRLPPRRGAARLARCADTTSTPGEQLPNAHRHGVVHNLRRTTGANTPAHGHLSQLSALSALGSLSSRLALGSLSSQLSSLSALSALGSLSSRLS